MTSGFLFARFNEMRAGFPNPTVSAHTSGTTTRKGRSSVISPLGEDSAAVSLSTLPWAELVLGLTVMLSRFRFRLEARAKIETDAWLTLRPKERGTCDRIISLIADKARVSLPP